MSKIYLELLDKTRQDVLYQLRVFGRYGYLAGGTALALQLNHRKSVDFDVFVNAPIGMSLRKKIRETFGDHPYEVNTADQITFAINQNVEMTFLYYYYPPVRPMVATSSLSLASVEDIVADKAHTLGRRAVWREYIDLFVVMKDHGMSIENIIAAAGKKFGGEFVKDQFVEQLSYFDDLAVMPIEFTKQSYEPNEIKSFLTSQTKAYSKTLRLR